jgi:hypothetical protein
MAPVGPAEEETERISDLLSCVSAFEPDIEHCILIDDSGTDRDLCAILADRSAINVISLPNPRRGIGRPLQGGLACGILSALAWVYANLSVSFVLKLDTDSLVIAPFSTSVHAAFSHLPDAGVVGVLGRTCNREAPDFGWERNKTPRFLAWLNRLGAAKPNSAALPAWAENLRSSRLGADELESWFAIAPHVQMAVREGYRTLEYAQGGGYAISREMINRMIAAGYLERPEIWAPLPFGEDVVMGMYTRAVGLRVCDLSDRGQPFGVHWKGLAFSPEELLRRGYSIIHSVKAYQDFSESQIRDYFAQRRRPRSVK